MFATPDPNSAATILSALVLLWLGLFAGPASSSASNSQDRPPEPKVTVVERPPSEVGPGESFHLEITAKNVGEKASYGSIAISFPTLTEPGDARAVEILGAAPSAQKDKYEIGSELATRDGELISSKYLLVEQGGTEPWGAGETKHIRIRVTPSAGEAFSSGKFLIQHRVTLEKETWPSPGEDKPTDQQNWSVRQTFVQVGDPTRATAEPRADETPALQSSQYRERRLQIYEELARTLKPAYWVNRGDDQLKQYAAHWTSQLESPLSFLQGAVAEAAGAGYYGDATEAVRQLVSAGAAVRHWQIGKIEGWALGEVRTDPEVRSFDPDETMRNIARRVEKGQRKKVLSEVKDLVSKIERWRNALNAAESRVSSANREMRPTANQRGGAITLVTPDAGRKWTQTIRIANARKPKVPIRLTIELDTWASLSKGAYQVQLKNPHTGKTYIESRWDANSWSNTLTSRWGVNTKVSRADPEVKATFKVQEAASVDVTFRVTADVNWRGIERKKVEDPGIFKELAQRFDAALNEQALKAARKHLTVVIRFLKAETNVLASEGGRIRNDSRQLATRLQSYLKKRTTQPSAFWLVNHNGDEYNTYYLTRPNPGILEDYDGDEWVIYDARPQIDKGLIHWLVGIEHNPTKAYTGYTSSFGIIVTNTKGKVISKYRLNKTPLMNTGGSLGSMTIKKNTIYWSQKGNIIRYDINNDLGQTVFEGNSSINEFDVNISDREIYIATENALLRYNINSENINKIHEGEVFDIEHIESKESIIALLDRRTMCINKGDKKYIYEDFRSLHAVNENMFYFDMKENDSIAGRINAKKCITNETKSVSEYGNKDVIENHGQFKDYADPKIVKFREYQIK